MKVALKYVPLSLVDFNEGQLEGVPANPRTREDSRQEKLAESIEELPEMSEARPPMVLPRDGRYIVIGGNRRLEAFRDLNREEMPVVVLPEDTPVEKLRRIVLLDNESTGETDWAAVMKNWKADELESWGIDVPDWGGENVSKQYKEIEEDEYEEDAPSKVERGDVWALGNHKLYCGDACDGESIKAFLEGECVDLWLTDPPYNVDYTGKTEESLKIENDNMGSSEFKEFLIKAFKTACDVMRPGCPFYIWHADTARDIFQDALTETGLLLKQNLIWNKSSAVLGRQDYHWKHEPCLYGWKGGAAHKWYADRKQTTVLNFARPNVNDIHPTMKPVALFAYLIENSSTNGNVIFDNFGGSGTTIIACEQTGRKARVVELDKHYCDAIIQRYEKLTGDAAIKLTNLK